MAYRTLAQFYDLLRIGSYTFELSENLIISRTGGGEILTAENGPRLWHGTVNIAPTSLADFRRQQALVQRMMNAGEKFEMTDARRAAPLNDKTGKVAGGTTTALNGYTMSIGIGSTNAGLKMSAGDLFTLISGGRRYLHEIAEDSAATTSGGVVAIKTTHPSKLTVNGSYTANFKRPALIAQIVPGSYKAPQINVDHASGFSFDWIQVFKE